MLLADLIESAGNVFLDENYQLTPQDRKYLHASLHGTAEELRIAIELQHGNPQPQRT